VAKGKKKGSKPRVPAGRRPQAAPGAGIKRALDLWKKGELAQAESACAALLLAQPRDVEANHLAGVIRLQRKAPADALPYLETALKAAPEHPRVAENHARCLEMLQRDEEAERAYRKALRLQPDNDGLAVLFGELLDRVGRADEAEPVFRAALKRNPRNAGAWYRVGQLERKAGRLEESEQAFRKAIELRPAHAPTWNGLGVLMADRDRHADAQAAFRKAAELNPGNSVFWANLGRSLERDGKFADAVEACRRGTEINPRDAIVWLRLAVAQRRAGEDGPASASLERARALDSGNADWWNDYGVELKTLARYDEAKAAYDRALAIAPDNAKPWTNIGNLRKELADFDGAEEAYRRALDSGYAPARYNLTLLQGLRGKLSEFWVDYEWRFAKENTAPDAVKLPDLPMPMWQGEPLAGKRLLVWVEQGLGDQIQFVRYQRLLQEAGAQATWVVAAPLKSLMRTLRWPAEFRTPKEVDKNAGYDYWSFALSLPRHFDTRLDTIPAEVPYLKADPKKVQHWRERLSRWQGKRRIGLAWAGNPKHVNDRNRSIPLAEFGALAKVPDCVFFSLQKGEREKDLAHPPPGMEIVPLGAELKDFSDSAALLTVLDLLITCDSSPAHLAGALARPVWTLVPVTPDWRWMMTRPDSPWYPSMRLFRQPLVGDWAAVMADIAAALSADSRSQIQQAVTEHRAGRMAEAEKLYRSVLANDPQNFDALNMLGAIALQRGDAAAAERGILAALAVRPQHPVALSNLGNALGDLGRWEEAVERFRQALAMRPDFPDARKNLDNALRRMHAKLRPGGAAAPSPTPVPAPKAARPASSLRDREFMQRPFDCAVLIRTTLRASLPAAVESVYAQDFKGRVQILIGVDRRDGAPPGLDALLRDKCPPNMGVTVIDPGYSTAARNGGLYSASAGGALLTTLAYLANAPRIACLDDDNRMCPDHLRRLMQAMEGHDWAFSLRWFVNPANGERITIDRWESVGPGRGGYNKQFGGFVDMNSWMVDKLKLHKLLPALSIGPMKGGGGNDRAFFEVLRKLPCGETNEATSEYVISPSDQNHATRLHWFAKSGYDVAKIPQPGALSSAVSGVHAPRG
jgi:tetratricopeptide (TPR) repeat protein